MRWKVMASCRKAAIATLAACLVAAVGACGSDDAGEAASADGLTRLAARFTSTANSAQLELGVKQGIFEKHGIELVHVPGTGAGANSVALLLNGQIQLAFTDITAVPSAVAAGFPVQVVASLSADYESPNGDAFAVIVPEDSDIRSFEDLEGRTVAVNGLESFWDLEVREAVGKAGGDPSRVEMVAVPFPDQVAALKQGRVDAVSTFQPFSGQLLADGHRSIGDPAAEALGPQSIGSVIMASNQYIDENPDAMKRFVAALEEAVAYANDHPEEVRATISETTGAPAEAVANLQLPWYVSGVDRKSAEAFTRLMVKHGLLESAPAVDEIVWPEAPDADLTTPPRGLEVSE
jgi:NitT/TauT family transport system substrate-binding protein